MEYYCKNCKKPEQARSFEEIMKYRKLCTSCLSKENNFKRNRWSKGEKAKRLKAKKDDN